MTSHRSLDIVGELVGIGRQISGYFSARDGSPDLPPAPVPAVAVADPNLCGDVEAGESDASVAIEPVPAVPAVFARPVADGTAIPGTRLLPIALARPVGVVPARLVDASPLVATAPPPSSATPAARPQPAAPVRRATGAWAYSLFGCLDGGHALLVAGCCCWPVLTGQLRQSVFHQRGACWRTVGCFACLYAALLALISLAYLEYAGTIHTGVRLLSGRLRTFDVAARACVLLIVAVTASAIATVRSRVRLRDRIVGSACEDCGISGCCAVCALLQMARHEGWDERGAKYALCSPAGVPAARESRPSELIRV